MHQQQQKRQQLYKSLRRATESLHNHLYRQASNPRLSPSQFAVLEVLARRGSLSQRELAEAAQRSSGNMTVVVDNLERRGLVARSSIAGDRRVVQVHLTPAGEVTIRSLLPSREARMEQVFHEFTEPEMEQLRELCERIAVRIEQEQ